MTEEREGSAGSGTKTSTQLRLGKGFPISDGRPDQGPGREVLFGDCTVDPSEVPAVRRLAEHMGEFEGVGFPKSRRRRG